MKEVYNDRMTCVDPTQRYVHIQWDGLWDRKREEYLDWWSIEKLCNQSDFNSRVWVKKYDEIKKENQILKKRISYLEGLLRKHNLEGFK